MRTACIGIGLAAAATLAALPAAAQMYKWTDERGVVSYSNTPPPNSSSKKVDKVEERVSVYTPDEQTMRAVDEEVMGNKRAARLEAQREAEARYNARQPSAPSRTTVATVEAQLRAAYDRCVSERRVECDSILSGVPSAASYGYNSYYGPAYVVGARNPPPPFAILEVPQTRIGVNPAPPVGISTAPKVGAPKTEDQPRLGSPQRLRSR